MSVTVNRDELKKALTAIRPAVGKGLDRLVRIDAPGEEELIFEAGDYDLRIAVLVDTVDSGTFGDVFPFYVDMRTLSLFVNAADKGALIDIDSHQDKKAILLSGRDWVEIENDFLRGVEADRPGYGITVQTPWPRPAATTTWSAGAGAISAIRAAAVVACRDDCRPVLCQVLLDADEGVAVATDSYRMMVASGIDVPDTIMLPRKVVAAMRPEVCEALVTYDPARPGNDNGTFLEVACDNRVTIQANRHSLGVFPTWKQLMPVASMVGLQVDRDKALRQLTALSIWGAGSAVPGRLVWNGEAVEWYHKEEGTIRAGVLDATDRLDGSLRLTVGFNPDYLAAAIRSIPTPVVHWDMIDNLKPVVFSDPEGTVKHLLMPVRMA